jgi:hypothetical protein
MLLGGVSDIQVATLAVAAIAATASIVGGVLVTLLNRRSDKETWLRDTRIRVYARCLEEAEEYFFNVFWPAKLEAADGEDAVAKTRARVLESHFRGTMSALSDVMTFGAGEVQAAAIELLQGFSTAVDLAKNATAGSSELVEAVLELNTLLFLLRDRVRYSLDIPK